MPPVTEPLDRSLKSGKEAVTLKTLEGIEEIHVYTEEEIRNSGLPQSLKPLILKIYQIYPNQTVVTPRELLQLMHELLAQESVLKEALNTPELEPFIAEVSEFMLSDFMPQINPNFHFLHMDDVDRAIDQIACIGSRLALEKLEEVESPDPFSDPEKYASYIFILMRTLDGIYLDDPDNDGLAKRAEKVVEENFDSLQGIVDSLISRNKKPMKKYTAEYCLSIYRMMLKQGAVPEKEGKITSATLLQKVLGEASQIDVETFFTALIKPGDFGHPNDTELRPDIEKVVRAYFETIGLSFDKIFPDWLDSSIDPRNMSVKDKLRATNLLISTVHQNIHRIVSLETKHPHASKYLHETFGITNFARYSLEFLSRQYTERDMQGSYGIIMNVPYDHNGASQNVSHIVDPLTEKISPHYYIRAIEAGGKVELAKKLLTLEKKYGWSQKIAFAIISAHGSEKRITLSTKRRTTPDDSVITLYDLVGGGVTRSEDFFKPAAPIVLRSCSTGAGDGFAQEASSRLNLTFIAPTEDVSTRSIDVKISPDGMITFDPKFVNEEGNEVEAVTYTPKNR